MQTVKRIVIVSLLGLFLTACGNSDAPGPFGNTPGPKKPQQTNSLVSPSLYSGFLFKELLCFTYEIIQVIVF
jgi:hypothetical protein